MTRRRIVPDDHCATIEHFLARLDGRGALGTVVHVGAHAGEEVDAYRRHGAERIVLVEANPASCEALEARFGGDADVGIVHAALADREGPQRLLVHANARGETESASLLPMKRLGEIVPTLRTEREVEVPGTTLDALLPRLGVDAAAVGLLALDVQGAELQVLRGGRGSLAAVRAVLCEVALVELYDGAAGEREVEALLTSVGFTAHDALYYELYEGDHRFPAWGDRLFVR